jgi:phage recombination protein Bet
MESSVQIANQQISFTDEQVNLIKKQIAPKATNDELQLFLYQAKRTGLDPLTRQIYCIHRRQKQGNDWIDKMTIQTSIDGFRVIAERSGNYGGQDEPEFFNEEGKLNCKIRVYKFRGEQRYQASVGVAYWDEYCPQAGQDHMWRKMPHTMIAKVAEALALRKAYPQDLSGLYTNDEMQQADNTAAPKQEGDDPGILTSLHDEFMELYDELVRMKAPEAEKLHPDRWKGPKTAKNYISAIAAIKIRINEELEK